MADEVRKEMRKLGFKVSLLHPPVHYKVGSQTCVVVHADDFLCIGPRLELESLYDNLRRVDDLRSTMLREGVPEMKYLNKVDEGGGRESELGM